VTSFTNSAVDNILARMVQRYPETKEFIVRLGNPDSMAPLSKEFIFQAEECPTV
jgi:hypothetical protein